MSNQNFYEELDLKYIEIGYNMSPINRLNPGSVPFSIPVLTPDLDNNSMKTNKVIQRDKSTIQNTSTGTVEVSDIEISNYIYITVPKELCALAGGNYNVEGNLTLNGNATQSTSGNFSNTIDRLSIEGSVSEEYGTVSGNGSSRGTTTLQLTGTIDQTVTAKGSLTLTPVDSVIPAKSKWAICFIGGDINMPMVLCRLP